MAVQTTLQNKKSMRNWTKPWKRLLEMKNLHLRKTKKTRRMIRLA